MIPAITGICLPGRDSWHAYMQKSVNRENRYPWLDEGAEVVFMARFDLDRGTWSALWATPFQEYDGVRSKVCLG